MCGIAGIIVVRSFDSRAQRDGALGAPAEAIITDATLDALDAGIAHRGPDGKGRFRDRALPDDWHIIDMALVHRRLAIIDPRDGAQPMVAEPRASFGRQTHGRLAVVFNGCIYNHRELREELRRQGHDFATDHSDTEVLLHGHRRWFDELPDRLDGMFAYAIWDAARGMLVLCRDRFGEKPLYARDASVKGLESGAPRHDAYVFSSVAASLERIPGLRDAAQRWAVNAAERTGVSAMWSRMGFGVGTPTGEVIEVPPAGWLPLGTREKMNEHAHPEHTLDLSRTLKGEHGRSEPRWCVILRAREQVITPKDVDALLDAAVAERLDADVPVGVFLSGGIDSALIAAYARRHRPDIEAFTVRMPDARYDESEAAAETARHLGIRHTILDCQPTPAADMVRLIEQIGLPLGDSSLLPTFWLCAAVRRRVSVALSGDGGDELFAGYERHRAARLLANPFVRLIGWLNSLLPWWGGASPKSVRYRLARFLHAAGGAGVMDLIAPFNTDKGRREAWLALACREAPYSEHADPIARAIAFDLLNYLPGDLSRKVDSAAMSIALEVRAPFLDNAVVAAATGAPIASLMPGGKRKGLLRQVARLHLPGAIVDRPKSGFAIPIGEWFRDDYGGMKGLLLERLSLADPFPGTGLFTQTFPRERIDRLIRDHLSGRRDHGQRLYLLLALAIWSQWRHRLRG